MHTPYTRMPSPCAQRLSTALTTVLGRVAAQETLAGRDGFWVNFSSTSLPGGWSKKDGWVVVIVKGV